MNSIERDTLLMEILKISHISHFIANTSAGDLYLKIAYGEKQYTFTLDAVPVEKEIAEDLMEVMFPKPKLVPIVGFPTPTAYMESMSSTPIPEPVTNVSSTEDTELGMYSDPTLTGDDIAMIEGRDEPDQEEDNNPDLEEPK